MNAKKFLIIIFLIYTCSVSSFAGIFIDGSLTHEVSAGPGESYDGTIIISNNGDEPEEVKLYLTDYSTEAGGKKYYMDPGTTARSNASWITVSPMRFFIPAHEDYTVYFTVDIPGDNTMTGTYWSMMMIEAIPKESPESSFFDPEEVTIGVSTILRYGVRIISHINESGTISPEIIKAGLNDEDDIVTLSLDIKNTGTRLFRLDFWVELYDTGGNYIGKYNGERLAVFPDSSIRFSADLSEVPKADYMALVVLDCGNDNVFGINYNLELK